MSFILRSCLKIVFNISFDCKSGRWWHRSRRRGWCHHQPQYWGTKFHF